MDTARDRFDQRQAPFSSMALSSGQSFYTVESLEGASSLPLLSSSFSAPHSFLGLDAPTRALLPDRDPADARARLLAAERESLLRRDVRPSADGLTSLEAPSRFDWIPPFDARTRRSFDELQGFDPRTRALSLDRHSQDAFRLGIDDREGSFAPFGRLAQERSDMILAKELAAGRSFFPPSTDYQPGRRDIDVRSPALPSYSSFPHRDSQNRVAASFSGSARSIDAREQEPPAPRPAPAEVTRNEEKGRELPFEKSKGWCDVCKIRCRNERNWKVHLLGERHTVNLESKLMKLKEPSDEVKSMTVVASEAEKKRVSDSKSEALPGAKRLKAVDAAVENGALVKASASTMGMADKRQWLTCEICKIYTTGDYNMDLHLKGKRHAARVKERASSQVAK